MDNRTEQVFRAADRNLNCNTAYPVFKSAFEKYETDRDILRDAGELSYYIHIPFCRHLCAFCEYTRFKAGNRAQEDAYLGLLEKQIREFLEAHRISRVYGLDIGGGTPSALDDDNFERMLNSADLLLSGGGRGAAPEKVPDFENSIEISFTTVNERKIGSIGQHRFRRVSAGIQSMNHELIRKYGRDYNPVSEILRYMDLLHQAGVEKVNLDFMYGMPGQTDPAMRDTIEAIEILRPEQVTLYEMRFNRVGNGRNQVTRDEQYRQYALLYRALTDMGYHGRFGKNSFTLGSDRGVSSYLWYRMDEGIPYKGFGISAQSMGPHGLSYGSLKNTELKTIPRMDHIGTVSNYDLPPCETAAKYVSIAMYNGSFRLDVLSGLLGEDAEKHFAGELAFLKQREYIRQRGPCIEITEKGFRYYGAVTALFWSDEQKELLLKNDQEKGNET